MERFSLLYYYYPYYAQDNFRLRKDDIFIFYVKSTVRVVYSKLEL